MDALRACKAALDEGLIGERDYAKAKDWFLFAQRVAQCAETGVLREQDVESVRAEMMRAIASGSTTLSMDVRALLEDGRPEDAEVLRETKFNVKKSAVAMPTFMVKVEDAERAAVAAAAARPGTENEETAAAVEPEAPKPPKPPAPPSAPAPKPPAPPSAPAAPVAAGNKSGTSMSGVAVAEDCVSIFNKVKMRTSNLQWATFRVEENEGSVLTDSTGEVSGAYDDFLNALPEGECRYAVYDYKYTNADGCEYSKLVFIVWNPDSARLKNKMLYASTKDFFKSRLSGIAIEIQATDLDEVSESELRENIGVVLTRK